MPALTKPAAIFVVILFVKNLFMIFLGHGENRGFSGFGACPVPRHGAQRI
jgi:hypothetical protein